MGPLSNEKLNYGEEKGGISQHLQAKTQPRSWLNCSGSTAGMLRRQTELVWRGSLMGGDLILLIEEEAEGYWGLVFP